MQKAIYWLKNKSLGFKIKSIGVLLIPVALFFVPIDWLQQQHSICIYKNITGHECYGCGITRAVLYALHFQFQTAFEQNKLVVAVMPVLVFLWLKMFNKIS